jgi:hypothetical protein
MENLLTNKQLENLSHTKCGSFLVSQYDRFEIFESNEATMIADEFPDNECVIEFYESRLEALFAFNHYKKSHKTLLVWDMDMENWGTVIRDKISAQILKQDGKRIEWHRYCSQAEASKRTP